MHITQLTSVHDLPESDWNALVGCDYPFLRHEFLAALEDSKATSADTGWQPLHLLALADDQTPLALLPVFIKSHSYGEYVFDWSWADAYHRSGREYYPKLLTAIPFTPATGPRLCVANSLAETDIAEVTDALFSHLKQLAKQISASSWHCLFPPETVSEHLRERGFSQRQGCQFHWFNQGFNNFDDFLGTFSSRKRKNLRKERQKVPDQGITLKRHLGTDLAPEDWQRFYDFYRRTYLKRSGHDGYLNRQFFEQLGSTMADQLLLVEAYENDRAIAASLFFYSSSHLYGRYWGALREYDGLHFEACYYQGIEFAIERGISVFDPGAQGEHKIQRGFTPIRTWSNHWMADPQLHQAVADFVQREQPSIDAYIAEATSLLPFKQTDG